MNENEISLMIVRGAIEVHRTLGGPGLLESVYEEALTWELGQANLSVQRQVQLPIPYKGQVLATLLRIDLIVNELVIVECKATSHYNTIFEAQTTDRTQTGSGDQLRRATGQRRRSSSCEWSLTPSRKGAETQRKS